MESRHSEHDHQSTLEKDKRRSQKWKLRAEKREDVQNSRDICKEHVLVSKRVYIKRRDLERCLRLKDGDVFQHRT